MGKISVSVLIPTFKRGNLIGHVLLGLSNQNYRDFEVIVVLKPSGDGTEAVISNYEKSLKIRLVLQKKGNLINALNLGLENASGDIIAFLDDDSIPFPDWIRNLIETYNTPNVGGAAGDVISANLNTSSGVLSEGLSEIIPETMPFMQKIGRQLWDSPIVGLEDYFVYLSKAGMVSYNFDLAKQASCKNTKALLGMGANMSVLAKAVDGFKFPVSAWVFGLSNEQFLGWYIWKKGYSLLFNPDAKVYHIAHGSMSRNLVANKKQTLCKVEANMLFYRMYDIEPGLSFMHRITFLIFSSFFEIKKICRNKEISRISFLKNIAWCEIIGLTWILSRRVGSNYTPQKYLSKFLMQKTQSD